MPDYQISFADSEVYECGATLISLLAYPDDDKNNTRRSNLHTSLCALALRAKFDDSEDSTTPQPMKPIYALRDQQQISRDLKGVKLRLRDRMVAAKMAIPLLRETESGTAPPLPASMKRLSINALAELVLGDAKKKQSGKCRDPDVAP